MTDSLDFEARLESRLRARAASAVRPFDAAAIARHALAPGHDTGGLPRRWVSLPRSLRWSVLALAIAASLLGAIAVGGPILERSLRPQTVSNGWIAYALRGFERVSDSDIHVVQPGTTPRLLVGSIDDQVIQDCPTFSHDGTHFAYRRGPLDLETEAREIVVGAFDSESGELRDEVVLASALGAGCPKWSPDGQRIAFSTGPELWAVGLDQTREEVFSAEGVRGAVTFDWSTAGAGLAVAVESTLWVVPLDGGQPRVVYEADSDIHIFSPTWLQGGDRIVISTGHVDGASEPLPALIISADVSAAPQALAVAGDSLTAWSPREDSVAFVRETGMGDDEIVTISIDNGDERILTSGPGGVRGLIWSPDGSTILYVTNRDDLHGDLFTVSSAGDAGPVVVTQAPLFITYNSRSRDLAWQPVSGARIDSPQLPTPIATVSGATVHDWPGARGDDGPGLYHWDLEGGAWMHNVSEAYDGASVLFSEAAFGLNGLGPKDGIGGPGWIDVSVAGHHAAYQEATPDVFGVRRLYWHVRDVAGGFVFITVELQPETTDAAEMEIRALVGSLRLEPAATPTGFRLVFESAGGWDSG